MGSFEVVKKGMDSLKNVSYNRVIGLSFFYSLSFSGNRLLGDKPHRFTQSVKRGQRAPTSDM